ncbi:MAG TPA: porphobilinogen synthase [Candidatus Paceibacterota bacterium]|nr:porphobilinogen synthase [Candidatus Paceibacterota bacterium]
MKITHRPRRLRVNSTMRNLVTENRLNKESLILPLFVREGASQPTPIRNMPGVVQHSQASLEKEIRRAMQLGIGGVMVFAIPEKRDEVGSEAINPNGILNSSIRFIREIAGDELVIIADLCLDEFTNHGHCGVLDSAGRVDNDQTLEIYGKMAVLLAQSGAHMLGASGMMDGQVGVARSALDEAGFQDISILAYAAKYASAFYGPFREAVDSQLTGDRKTYQQDPANIKESIREIELDIEEGADVIMIKPGLMYLDVLHAASQFVNLPLASYIVSGEMAMIEAAAAAGAIDRERAIIEALTSVRRAGAQIICTYWALEVAELLERKS